MLIIGHFEPATYRLLIDRVSTELRVALEILLSRQVYDLYKVYYHSRSRKRSTRIVNVLTHCPLYTTNSYVPTTTKAQ